MSPIAKTAILIDGGYFLKRLPEVHRGIDTSRPEQVVGAIDQLVGSHLKQLNQVHRVPNPFQLLYRCFYYDAWPYASKGEKPVSKHAVDYDRSDVATSRRALFDALRRRPNLALRLGHVSRPGNRSWILKADPQARLLNGDIEASDLEDSHFEPNLRQKGVDMRIGLDIATLTLKKQANVIILVAGDSDFVPAAKLARREGVTFILDPLWRNVSVDLSEHIDKMTSGFPNPHSVSETATADH